MGEHHHGKRDGFSSGVFLPVYAVATLPASRS